MEKKIDGVCFKNMVDYSVRNLNKHVKTVNRLNVFPVPDGDTGTNMVTTIHKGLRAIEDSIVDLNTISRKFARSVVFEARGNSGVIVSQFLKGMSEKFYDVEVADSKLFIEALENGVRYAYQSVAVPVEGTMLTVVKDATMAVKREYNGTQDVAQIIDSFVKHAKRSLENTPELLRVLKDSGVVDSGGAGIVYLFEGMKKYLDGETLDDLESDKESEAVDYDLFNRSSRFEYGYCTELLLQLLDGRDDFDRASFKDELGAIGDSIVISAEGDKVRVHIHTHYPEKVFSLCHRYGEFLSSKIENMTVQHTESMGRIICSDSMNNGAFSVVAVAYDADIQKLFIEMGADISVCCDGNMSTKDYIEAFEQSESENIIVFPNSSDAILSAMQAKKLYRKAKITVINSRSIAECYAALPTIDFEETNIETVTDSMTEIINNLYIVSVAQRDSRAIYKGREINRGEYYSFSGKELIAINQSLKKTAAITLKKVIEKKNKEIVTIFYKPYIGEKNIGLITDAVGKAGTVAEFFLVPCESLPCEMTISFE